MDADLPFVTRHRTLWSAIVQRPVPGTRRGHGPNSGRVAEHRFEPPKFELLAQSSTSLGCSICCCYSNPETTLSKRSVFASSDPNKHPRRPVTPVPTPRLLSKLSNTPADEPYKEEELVLVDRLLAPDLHPVQMSFTTIVLFVLLLVSEAFLEQHSTQTARSLLQRDVGRAEGQSEVQRRHDIESVRAFLR